MSGETTLWIIFGVMFTVMIAIDLMANRKSHELSFREALGWTAVWVSLAAVFAGCVAYFQGSAKALEFVTGYIIEESLSVDNLFVFIMIFSYFNVPKQYQPRILKWGIFGAIIMRGIFIVVGVELLERFHWMIYVFGAFLIVTGIKMLKGGDEEIDPEKSFVIRIARKFVPVSRTFPNGRFFIRKNGVFAVTPLFLVLLLVESTDVVFALDSIPAIFAVSRDPMIVYTSNIFAIMGLRALFFLLVNVLGMFAYLKVGVSVVLTFVGVKMLLIGSPYEVPTPVSLMVVVGVLAGSILASIFFAPKPVEEGGAVE